MFGRIFGGAEQEHGGVAGVRGMEAGMMIGDPLAAGDDRLRHGIAAAGKTSLLRISMRTLMSISKR